MRVESTTTDPVAVVAAAIFGFGCLLSIVMIVGTAMQQRWPVTTVFAALLVIFGSQLYGWAGSARARLTIDHEGARRLGPQGWFVPREALGQARIETLRGRPYLIADEPNRARQSLTMTVLPGRHPTTAVACPVEAGKVDPVADALKQSR